MGSGDSEESSSDSGCHPQGPTSGKALVKIPIPKTRTRFKPNRSEFKQGFPKRPRGAHSDSIICHSCRRPSSRRCARCSRCALSFCEKCLARRHGEDVLEVSKQEVQWVCPKCRGGCGPGCEKCCCTCSKCCIYVKKIQPIGVSASCRLMKEARLNGWNRHDYQIHLQTHESKEEIANRKVFRGWTTMASGNKMHSNITNKGNDHRPTEHKGPFDKRRSPGHGYNHGGITATMDNFCSGDNGQGFSAKENVDGGTTSKALTDSLLAFSSMAVNIYLIDLWFTREKDILGNQMSIILNDKELQQKTNINARSPAKRIAFEFHPSRFMSKRPCEQARMKQCLKEILKNELADSKARIQQFYKEVHQEVVEPLRKANRDIELMINCMVDQVKEKTDLDTTP